MRTEVVTVRLVAGDDIAGYDPEPSGFSWIGELDKEIPKPRRFNLKLFLAVVRLPLAISEAVIRRLGDVEIVS